MTKFRVIAVLLTMLAADSAQAQKLAYAGGVTGLRDVVYAELPGFRPLSLDLYQPPPTARKFPRPTLIFVHGGGFSDFPAVLASLVAKNYVVASVVRRQSL